MKALDPTDTIAALGRVWQSIASVTDGLNDGEWARATECPGWDVADQVIHLMGVERQIEGEQPPRGDVSDVAYVKNEFGAYNERWIRDRRPRGGVAIREEFIEVTTRRLATLSSLRPSAFDATVWSPMGDRSMAELLTMRLFDSFVHEIDIRRALDKPGQRDDVAEQVALTWMAKAIPGVLGRIGSLAEAESLTLELGPGGKGPWSWVNNGERIVPGSGTIRATITVSPESLLLRDCGRVGVSETLAEPRVSITGDRELAEVFLERLNVVP